MPTWTARRGSAPERIAAVMALVSAALMVGCARTTGRHSGAPPQQPRPPAATQPAADRPSPVASAPAPARQSAARQSAARQSAASPPKTPTAPRASIARTLHGSGTFRTVAARYPPTGSGRVVRYAVQIEGGIPVDRSDFAAQIHATLVDPRGWQGVDQVAFAEVADIGQADIVVTLATPPTTDALCAPLDTAGRLDCWNGSRAVINSDRWLYGAQSYGTDLAAYRREVVNHEVGHGLGHPHRFCPGPGQPAPVMQQQTIGLQGCRANPWPELTSG